jgi:hypothetical protein
MLWKPQWDYWISRVYFIIDSSSLFLSNDVTLRCHPSLPFQDLLQMQYEGVAVMKMFDKVKVNVNLLIYLLNKKFYGK